MSDFPHKGSVDATRQWLDDNGFDNCFVGWKADALFGADKEDVLSEFPDNPNKGKQLWGLLNTARFSSSSGGNRKLYVVTHWESGLLREVSFTKGDTLRRFLISVGIAFNAGPVSRLYALYPESTHDQRLKIESTEMLNAVLTDIDNDSANLEILYVYPEDRSPTSSPAKGVTSPVGEDADKSETSSAKSDRSTYQKRFKRELKRRDKSKCLIVWFPGRPNWTTGK